MDEMEMLLEAARDMRIRGYDSQNHSAVDDFVAYYYQTWDECQRKQDTSDAMFFKAYDWWQENGHKYL